MIELGAPILVPSFSSGGGTAEDYLTYNPQQAQIDYNTAFMLQQQAFNSAEAQKQRDWQTEMSNTSYQRAVEDLRKAGLNPYLVASNNGAVTPSGANATSSLQSISSTASNSQSRLNSANTAKAWAQTIESISRTLKNIKKVVK